MADYPNGLSKARILLSNDDGIDAPGLKVLGRIARELSRDVWYCAPETEQSGAGHSLTLRRPLRLRRLASQRFAVDGTPTDCMVLAIHSILKDHPPDLVLSGVNRGGNMGEDITYSGTVAAAIEATILGAPAIALSQYVGDDRTKVHWPTAEAHAPDIIRRLCKIGWPAGTLININFPDVAAGDVAGIVVTQQGQRKVGENLHERIDPRGRPYYWIGALKNNIVPRAGTDLAVVAAGSISITPVHLDMTHTPSLKRLQQAFA